MKQEKLLPLTKTLGTKIRLLHRNRERDEQKLFLCEGIKCCEEVISSNYKIAFVDVNENELKNNTKIQILIKFFHSEDVNIYVAAQHIFEKLCDATSPQGIIAVVNYKNNTLKPNTNFVALDNISDPGNVGTIIRTALWFGIKQILLLGECASCYNPKVIRSSMGAVFHGNIIHLADGINIIKELFPKNIILSGDLKSNISIKEISIKEPFGLIVGNEARGVSVELDKIITKKFIIPGKGMESLNVAVATGIAMYELNFKK